MLLVWWCHIAINSASNDFELLPHENSTDNSKDLHVSSQHYRPYYYNRRPSNPSNYNSNNRRPIYYPPSSTSNLRPTTRPITNPQSLNNVNHRPPAVGSITREPSLCSSTDGINRNQRDWICWDWTNNKLKMGPNLKLESFIAFYARHVKSNIYLRDPVYNRPNFRKEICEQSKQRFGGVGIFCVPFKYIASGESEGECPPNAKKSLSVCHYHNQPDDGCICIDDQYHKILPASTH